MRTKTILITIMLSSVLLFFAHNSFALTTEELLKLKKSGVSEDIIVFMLENDYKDVEKVSKLKEAGFKDETIRAIIKNDLKNKPKPTSELEKQEITKEISAEKVNFETTAKVKIMWYMIYKKQPTLQNSQVIDDVKVSIVSNTIKFEWKGGGGSDPLNVFLKRPFKSPFIWDINKDDTFGPSKEGYAYMLKSTISHKGNPAIDSSHYWVVYFEPKDLKIADYINNSFSAR